MKYDKEDNLEWAKTIGGEGDEHSYSLQQTRDKGYVIAGITASYGAGETDGIILKYDKFGNLEWTKIFGGIEHDYITSINQTKDNGYITTGYTRSYGNFGKWDYFLTKFSELGEVEWSKITGGKNNDCALDAKETIDGQYIVAGCSKSYSHGYKSGNLKRDMLAKFDILLVKYDQKGDIVWNSVVGGDDHEFTFSLNQTQDRGYIVSGYSSSYVDKKNKLDAFLYKYNESGELSWAKAIGGTGDEKISFTQETQDSSYITTGHTTSYESDNLDIIFIKTKPEKSSIGNIIEPKISSPLIKSESIDLSTTISQ